MVEAVVMVVAGGDWWSRGEELVMVAGGREGR